MAKMVRAFQVEKVEGEFEREVVELVQDVKKVGFNQDKEIVTTKMVRRTQKFRDGYMLYFPQKHSMFIAADDHEQLTRLGVLSGRAPLVDLESGETAPEDYEVSPKEMVIANEMSRASKRGGFDALGLGSEVE